LGSVSFIASRSRDGERPRDAAGAGRAAAVAGLQ
jgi:hypothetical protein